MPGADPQLSQPEQDFVVKTAFSDPDAVRGKWEQAPGEDALRGERPTLCKAFSS